jgi:alkanesulfonate monooxygenase SsuD/methylene tetrahydromethanopterin reductase-like flavin-dependent oxidoreductase (luciferase family)
VLCAEEAAAAHWLHGSSRLSMLRLRAGRPSTLPSPEEAADRPYSAAEQAVIAEATGSHVVGDPATVIESLAGLVASTGAHELMVTTSTFGHADRLASYELLARAADPGGPGEQRTSSLLGVSAAVIPEQIRHAGGPGHAGVPAEPRG